MNVAIWAVAAAAREHRAEAVGVRRGFAGLLEGDLIELEPDRLAPSARRGGTVLGTSRLPDLPRRVEALVRQARRHALSGLVVIGGNGSLAAAGLLVAEAGRAASAGAGDAVAPAVVGVPATIDNDVNESEESLGFDTAVNTALWMVDHMRDTAEALPRLFVLETLGGSDGRLASAVGFASGADAVLDPAAPWTSDSLDGVVAAAIAARGYALLVACEGYPELDGVLADIEARRRLRLRFTRLGHAQRGGAPGFRDRSLGRRFGEAAGRALAEGRSARLLVRGGRVEVHPFAPPDGAR